MRDLRKGRWNVCRGAGWGLGFLDQFQGDSQFAQKLSLHPSTRSIGA
jgi:hypothetical protein